MTTAVATIPTEPGIYQGLSFADYHAIEAVNHSRLETFRRTPAHARYEMLHPSKDSEALATGRAFHVFLLEPERFDLEYVVAPDWPARSNADKARWKEWEEQNAGKSAIEEDELRTFRLMRDSVARHQTARAMLTGRGANELTLVWNDDRSGMLAKARLDRIGTLADYSFIIDLKTTKDAGEKPFAKDAGMFGYFRQLQWYRRGAAALRPTRDQRRCALIAVEKFPPYCVAVHEADERALEQADREIDHHLNTYAECMATGEWPAYGDGLGLIDYPSWLIDRME